MTIKGKRLIEVALPLEAINEASRREKGPFTKNHPRSIHVWWARRPLAASRAVLFASLVDDPSSHPDQFPTEKAQEKERQRLFRIIEEMVKWENINNPKVLDAARKEILKSTNSNPPPVLDPFCGGGSIPLEAQRLGLEAHASDLNPVAVLITKALIEIPPKFSGKPPVHLGQAKKLVKTEWKGAQGLAEDIRYYGKWMRDEAEKRIGHLYPKVKLSKEQGGVEATILAWIWARTVKCPNPACGAQMPLVRSFWLSTKKGKEAWVEPEIGQKRKEVRFSIKSGKGQPPEGTVNRKGAKCIVCGASVPFNHIRAEGRAGRMSSQLMAMVAEGENGRVYLSPLVGHEEIARKANPKDAPDTDLPEKALGFRIQAYGMTKHRDLFTPRQLVALTSFSDLVSEAREKTLADALKAGLADDDKILNDGGTGAAAYADAVATYLAIANSRSADFSNTICSWDSGNTNMRQLFARQAIPMAWDFAETNSIWGFVNITVCTEWIASALEHLVMETPGMVRQLDAVASIDGIKNPIVSTDPPYYDNIGYADISDFFYVWLRRSLVKIYPDLFSTLLVPKTQELVATPYRFGGDKEKAQKFFETGLGKTLERIRSIHNQHYPFTIYYAFKQAEKSDAADEGEEAIGISSTGWETMLEGLNKAGWSITGTWPMRTEQQQRSVAAGTNALASSIVLACRPRYPDATITTRKEFINSLKKELPEALKNLQHGNIAPVDLAQAAIGPGMSVFSRYNKVIEADGSTMSVRTALALINQVLDEYLSEQESEYDPDTRWALSWFDQFGMEPGPFGDADTLSKAKNTSVTGLVESGILESQKGKVRLLKRSEFSTDWDPATDSRMPIWELTQRLIHALETEGEQGSARLLKKIGGLGQIARDLAYRLYQTCERKSRASEAIAYNSLVVAWPEIVKLASEEEKVKPGKLF